MRLKLVSQKDTLLGHVDVPDHWGEYLRKGGAARSYIPPRLPFSWHEQSAAQPVALQTITLAVAHFSKHRDAVCLVEGTIEQLEAMPECSFTPSMAYLRSHFTNG